jgi:hypothetical protein
MISARKKEPSSGLYATYRNMTGTEGIVPTANIHIANSSSLAKCLHSNKGVLGGCSTARRKAQDPIVYITPIKTKRA